VHDQTRTAREIHHHAAQGFIQRHIGVAIAAQSLFVAHGLGHRLAQRDAHVLDRVVSIDVQIAIGLDVQVDQTMAGDLIEHVVKKANAGVHLALTRAVQVELHPDAGFGGLAADVGVRAFMVWLGWSIGGRRRGDGVGL